MRRNEPGVYGGLNASRVGLYGGNNAKNDGSNALQKIYRRSKWNAHRNLGVYKGINASGVVCRPKCFSKMCMKA